MKRLLLLLNFLTTCCGIAYAQNYSVNVQPGFWADSAQRPDIKPIIELYKHCLESRPDSIYDNPYWNSAEKEKYTDFDFS